MIAIRFMEFWTIIFAIAAKLIMAVVMLIVSGALYGSINDAINAVSFGCSIGSLIMKINNVANYVQDKVINFIMVITFSSILQTVEDSNMINE